MTWNCSVSPCKIYMTNDFEENRAMRDLCIVFGIQSEDTNFNFHYQAVDYISSREYVL